MTRQMYGAIQMVRAQNSNELLANVVLKSVKHVSESAVWGISRGVLNSGR